jgi:hypothetical protein
MAKRPSPPPPAKRDLVEKWLLLLQVIADPECDRGEIATMAAILETCIEGDTAYGAAEHLAKAACIGRATVFRSLPVLKERGWLEVSEPEGKRRSNLFRPTWERLNSETVSTVRPIWEFTPAKTLPQSQQRDGNSLNSETPTVSTVRHDSVVDSAVANPSPSKRAHMRMEEQKQEPLSPERLARLREMARATYLKLLDGGNETLLAQIEGNHRQHIEDLIPASRQTSDGAGKPIPPEAA